MPIELLSVCTWSKTDCATANTPQPTWEAVEGAVRALDNGAHNDLYLYPEASVPLTYLCIGGGKGRYVVSASLRGDKFFNVVDPSQPPDGFQSLVVGGQEGDYPTNAVVGLPTALAAARAYYDTGRCEGPVTWQPS
jgi:Immunity protein Imm1